MLLARVLVVKWDSGGVRLPACCSGAWLASPTRCGFLPLAVHAGSLTAFSKKYLTTGFS